MSELVRLFVYLLYFVIIFTFYGIPLPIIRDLWTSFRVRPPPPRTGPSHCSALGPEVLTCVLMVGAVCVLCSGHTVCA